MHQTKKLNRKSFLVTWVSWSEVEVQRGWNKRKSQVKFNSGLFYSPLQQFLLLLLTLTLLSLDLFCFAVMFFTLIPTNGGYMTFHDTQESPNETTANETILVEEI